jgi:hypothetical protein
MADLNNGKSEACGSEPKGYRDVYWCWVVNEPGIIHFTKSEKNPDMKLTCACCGWVDTDGGGDGSPSAVFLTEHSFVCHAKKPVKREAVGG